MGSASATPEKIPLDKLKQPDPILYYNELVLYEDELSDNGDSSLSIKLVCC
jgi:type 2A phosphatase activator TIP41